MDLLGLWDVAVFVAFVASVITVGLIKSRGEQTHSEHGAQDYFLAGRGLTWWLIGFSLIAANISTEQFVGMSGKAADWLGMAIASYEWMAAITLVVVAFLFLPTFLRTGHVHHPRVPRVPLQHVRPHRDGAVHDGHAGRRAHRLGDLLGGQGDHGELPGADACWGSTWATSPWAAGSSASCRRVYVFAGGLKACAWADLLQGTALILGGLVIAGFALNRLSDADPADLLQTARNQEVTVESLQATGPSSGSGT